MPRNCVSKALHLCQVIRQSTRLSDWFGVEPADPALPLVLHPRAEYARGLRGTVAVFCCWSAVAAGAWSRVLGGA